MPTQTATGFPFPLGTDRLMDGDDAIHALAAAIPQVQFGGSAITITTIDTNTSLAVTFPRAFASVPNVIVGVSSGPPGANYGQAAWATGIGVGGFTLNARRSTANPVGCQWVAICAPAA